MKKEQICKNCKWSWSIEKDDKNPYLCHRCGFDNKLNDYDIISLKKWQKENLPFIEEQYNDNEVFRTFEQKTDDSDLTWHMDNEDRIVESMEKTDWKIQLDNELPVFIEKIFIPKGVYHRVIKGSGDLKVKIKKL